MAPIRASSSSISPADLRHSTRRFAIGAAWLRPNQGLENPSRGRPHLLHQGRRQPVSPVLPRRSLLAPVGVAQRHAEALRLARRPVRHAAVAPDQDRGPRCRDENTDLLLPADRLAGLGHPAPRPRPHPAPSDVSDGARHAPNPSRNAFVIQNQPDLTATRRGAEHARPHACR